MAAAPAAMYFGAHHPVATVAGCLDRTRDWIVEARPARAAFEFLFRDEQFLFAPCTAERPRTLLIVQSTTPRPLGAVLAHDVELFGCQNLAPLSVGVRDRILLG